MLARIPMGKDSNIIIIYNPVYNLKKIYFQVLQSILGKVLESDFYQ